MAKTKSLNVSGNLIGLAGVNTFTGGEVFRFGDAVLGNLSGDPGNTSLKDDVTRFGTRFLDPIQTDPMGTIIKTVTTVIGGSAMQWVYRKATKGGVKLFGYKLR